MIDKTALRQQMLALRSTQDSKDKEHKSSSICRILLGSPEVARAGTVMGYLPTRGEVDLGQLYDEFEQQGIEVAFPRVTSQAKRLMEPFLTPAPWRDHVVRGSYNILEPSLGSMPVDLTRIDVVLIPGVAFDRDFYRLGFGGGYYDRFLPCLSPHTCLVGIGYGFQVVDELPRHPHDRRLDGLCTEHGLMFRPDYKWHKKG